MTDPSAEGLAEKPSMTMEDVRSGGRVRQESDAPAEQSMKKIDAAGDVEQIIHGIAGNLNAIAAELAELKFQLAAYDPNATAEIARMADAEAAARKGDSAGVVAALRGVARWVLEFATKAGTTVVAQIIETVLGVSPKS